MHHKMKYLGFDDNIILGEELFMNFETSFNEKGYTGYIAGIVQGQ